MWSYVPASPILPWMWVLSFEARRHHKPPHHPAIAKSTAPAAHSTRVVCNHLKPCATIGEHTVSFDERRAFLNVSKCLRGAIRFTPTEGTSMVAVATS